MSKIFLILTGVVLLISAYFSWQNRQDVVNASSSFEEVREKIKDVEDEIDVIEERVSQSNDEFAQKEKVKFENETKLGHMEAQIEAKKTSIAQLEEKQMALDQKIAEISDTLKSVDVDVSPEDLRDTIDEKNQEIARLKEEFQKLQQNLVVTDEHYEELKRTMEEFKRRDKKRMVIVKRNALEGVITAINRDWGFVIVNMGAATQDMALDTSLLVMRNGMNIGQLNVISVEKNRLIANVTKQRVQEMAIRPGDRVIIASVE